MGGEYNSDGALAADRFRFAADDAAVDLCFALSLSTHLMEAEAETARVLTPGGRAILSLPIEAAAGQV